MEEHKKIYIPLFFLMKLLMEMLQQNKGVNQEIRRYEIEETGYPTQVGQREVPDDAEGKPQHANQLTKGSQEGSLRKYHEG